MTARVATTGSRRDALLVRIEAMAVRGRERQWSHIPAELARAVRPRVVRFGDALVTLMEKSDSLRVNRVIGLGHRGEASEQTIDAIVAVFTSAKLRRFSIEVGPGPQVENITRWLRERGFARHGGYSLLLRDPSLPLPRVPGGVRAVRARGTNLDVVIDIFSETFATPASRRGWSLAAAKSGDVEYFLAFVGTRPAGVGALIAARLRRAARLGCRWAWSETAEPARGRPAISRRNLLRLGFEEACNKSCFLWQAGKTRR